jgi:GNAT superfamily N-acetyltransferase
MLEIAVLADHPQAIPTLAQWFQVQWPDYYAGLTAVDIEDGIRAEANRDGLPLRLVAFVEGDLAGTIVLRTRALEALSEYRPGLGGLFVAPRHRRRGVGTALVQAGMDAARGQGHQAIYAATTVARGILERLGWVLVTTAQAGDEAPAIYRCALGPRDRPRPPAGAPA